MKRHPRQDLTGRLLTCGLALAALAVAGCGPGAGSGSAVGTAATAPTAAASSADDSTMAIVTCYRAHGDPSFPAPVYDPGDGRWHFAVSPDSAPLATRQACQHLFPSVNASPPVPQARFAQLVQLATCMRQHGLPTWPDPDPDGSFGLPPNLIDKSPAYLHAITVCSRLIPNGGIDVHQTG